MEFSGKQIIKVKATKEELEALDRCIEILKDAVDSMENRACDIIDCGYPNYVYMDNIKGSIRTLENLKHTKIMR